MKLLFYAEHRAETGDRLIKKIQDQISADVVVSYRSFENLKHGLLQSLKPNIVVLTAVNAGELSRILSLDRLLTDMRIVLVLPDRHKGSVSAGHRLRPRYISYVDSDFEDVVAVVRQMLKLFPAIALKTGNLYSFDLKAVGHEV